MTTFTAITDEGRTVEYRDQKRWMWLLSLSLVIVGPLTAGLFYLTGSPLAAFFPLFYMYGFVPALDLLFGEDPYNPPEEIAPMMAADPFYRRLLHVAVPVFYASFLFACWFVGTNELPWWSIGVLAWGFGALHGDVLTIGHELGHKSDPTDRLMAKLINALIGYGHFCIEHNRGHHVWVSTPEDPASARMGESVYAFAGRELPGTMKRGWAHERLRLKNRGKGFWSIENEILQGYAITLVVATAVVAAFGWKMMPFLVIHHFMGWYQLTQANYVEHYGLKREKLANGKYEPVAPHHSWNTNHIVSNLMLFHLQRHSDHHANPQRPYQALRNFPDLPRLPSGYPGCYGLAAFPPLWFRVMDPKVAEWAMGDLSRANVDPAARDRLFEKYDRPAAKAEAA